MNFKQVESFRAVVLTGSMTMAAQQLHTSQSNVSRSISKLESEVGFKLFDRHGGRSTLTRAGDAFFRDVKRAFTSLETLESSARAIKTAGAGTLKVAAAASLSVGILPAAVNLFRQHYPLVGIVLDTSESSTIAGWVAHQQCDLGFVSYVLDKPGVTAELIDSSDAVCVVHSEHALANRSCVGPEDLKGEHFISLPAGNVSRVLIDGAFADVPRTMLLETPFAATICCLVRERLGVSVINPIFAKSLRLPGIMFVPFRPSIPFKSYAISNQAATHDVHCDFLKACVIKVFETTGVDSVR